MSGEGLNISPTTTTTESDEKYSLRTIPKLSMSHSQSTIKIKKKRKESNTYNKTKELLCFPTYVNQLIIISLYPTAILMTNTIIVGYGSKWLNGCKRIRNVDNDIECKVDYLLYNYYNSMFMSGIGLIAFIFSQYISKLSNKFGRKIFILFNIIASMIPRMSILIWNNMYLYWFIWLITGLNGGSDVTSGAMILYFKDILPRKYVGMGYRIIQRSTVIVSIIGSIIASLISYVYSDYEVWIVITSLFIITLVYCILFVPESLDYKKRKHIKVGCFNPFSSLISLLHIFDNKLTFWVSIVQLLRSTFDFGVITIVFVYFGYELDIHDPSRLNAIITVIFCSSGILRLISNNILLPYFYKHQFDDIFISAFSLFFTLISCILLILFGLYPNEYFGIGFGVTVGIHRIAQASLNKILSSTIYKKNLSKNIKTIQSMTGVSAMISPFLFGYGYNYFKNSLNMNYLIFFIDAVLIFIAFLILIIPLRMVYNNNIQSILKQKRLKQKHRNKYKKYFKTKPLNSNDTAGESLVSGDDASSYTSPNYAVKA